MISQMKSTQLLLTNNLWLCTNRKALPSGGAVLFYCLIAVQITLAEGK